MVVRSPPRPVNGHPRRVAPTRRSRSFLLLLRPPTICSCSLFSPERTAVAVHHAKCLTKCKTIPGDETCRFRSRVLPDFVNCMLIPKSDSTLPNVNLVLHAKGTKNVMIFIPMVSIMKQVCHKVPIYSSSVGLSDRHRTSQRLSDNFNYYFACDDDDDDDACFVDDAGCHGATDGWQCHRPLYFIELAGLALALSLLAPPAFLPAWCRSCIQKIPSIDRGCFWVESDAMPGFFVLEEIRMRKNENCSSSS